MIRDILKKNIRIARESAGWSKVKLGEELGISDQMVYYWETGRSAPEYGKIELMAEKLGKNWHWFFQDHETVVVTSHPTGVLIAEEPASKMAAFMRKITAMFPGSSEASEYLEILEGGKRHLTECYKMESPERVGGNYKVSDVVAISSEARLLLGIDSFKS